SFASRTGRGRRPPATTDHAAAEARHQDSRHSIHRLSRQGRGAPPYATNTQHGVFRTRDEGDSRAVIRRTKSHRQAIPYWIRPSGALSEFVRKSEQNSLPP